MSCRKQKILITGAAGYVGSSLVPYLLEMGHYIIAFDIFWFGKNTLASHENLEIVQGNIVDFDFTSILTNVDTVIHLACISNDPSFDLNPNLSKVNNFDSTINLTHQLNLSSVKRLIYASSSSVYGIKSEPEVHEELSLEPITPYALYKAQSEKYFIEMKNDNYDLVILRPATLCGPSPRLRLDLVSNILSSQSFYNRRITVHGGKQYRPQLNLKEMLYAYELCLNYSSKFNNDIFNVGEINYTVDDIVDLIKICSPTKFEIERQDIVDSRSYRISSEKFYHFFQYHPRHLLKDALNDLFSFYSAHPDLDISHSLYHNVKRMKELIHV